MRVLIVGGGCFGAAAACELAHRGHDVLVVDELGDETHVQPNKIAATTDTNKYESLWINVQLSIDFA